MTRHFHRCSWFPNTGPGPWLKTPPSKAGSLKSLFDSVYGDQYHSLEQKEFSAMPLNVYMAYRVTSSGDRIELGKLNAADLEEAAISAEAAFWHVIPKVNGHLIDKIEVEQVPGETAPDFDPDAISKDELLDTAEDTEGGFDESR